MALLLYLAYQEIISVHPTRRPIFAGKPYSTFWNIRDLLMYKKCDVQPLNVAIFYWRLWFFSWHPPRQILDKSTKIFTCMRLLLLHLVCVNFVKYQVSHIVPDWWKVHCHLHAILRVWYWNEYEWSDRLTYHVETRHLLLPVQSSTASMQ